MRMLRWALVLAAMVLIARAGPAQVFWDGGTSGTGTSWSSNTNWQGDNLPVSGNSIVFDSRTGTGTLPAALSLSGNFNLNTITFDNVNSRLPTALGIDTNGSGGSTARTLTLTGGIITQNYATASTVTFNSTNNGTMSIVFAGNQTMNIGANSTLTLAPIISETGGARTLTKTGLGNLTLSGANTFTGSTTITAGTLTISSDANLGTAPSTATAGYLTLNGGTLAIGTTATTINANRGIAVSANSTIATGIGTTYNGIIAGTGTLTKTGTSSLTLGGANTFSGGFNLNAGTVSFTSSAAFGTGPLVIGNAATNQAGFAPSPSTAFLNNTTAVDTTITNAVTLPTPTTATTYTIQKTASGGVLDFTGNIGGGNTNTKLFLQTSTGGDNTTRFRFAGNNTFAATIELWRGTIVVGSATGLGNATNVVRMNGNNNTTLGDLRFEVGGTFSQSFELLSSPNFNVNANDVTLSGIVSGSSTFRKLGSGTLTLTAANTFTSPTIIDTGTLQIGNGGTIGTLGNGAGTVTVNAALNFNRSDALPVANVLAGAGTINQIGAGTTTLSGTNTFTGVVNVTNGTLAVGTVANGGSNSNLGAATAAAANIVLNGGTLSYTGATATSDRGFTVGASNATVNVSNAASTLTLGGPLGTGTLTKTGPGGLTLSAFNTNSYSGTPTLDTGNGALTINGLVGTASLKTAGTGIISVGDVPLDGTFFGVFDINAAQTDITGIVSSFGSLSKNGNGILSLTNAANSYTGTVNVNQGTLRTVVSASAGQYAIASAATLLLDYGTSATSLPATSLAPTSSNLTFQLNQATLPGSPLINATGALTPTGTTTINLPNLAGGLPVGTLTLIQYTGTQVTSGFVLGSLPTPRTAAALDYSVAGRLNLNITGTDTIRWYGATTGEVANTTWNVGTAVNVGGTSNFKTNSSGTFTNFFTGDAVTFDDTAFGSGTVTVNLTADVAPASLIVNNPTRAYLFTGANAIAGGTGLTKSGAGILTLANNNTYTGTTTVNAGILQLGNGGTTGSVAGNIVNDGSLVFNRSDGTTYAGNISGTGTLTQLGTGITTLTGALTFAGQVTLTAGRLQLSPAADTTFANTITGPGDFAKSGTANLTVTGTNNYTGATSFNGGITTVPTLTDGGVAGPLGAATSAAGNLVFNGGRVNYTGADVSTNRGFTVDAGNGTIDVGTANVGFTGTLAGPGSLTKLGTGTFTLPGAAGITGGLIVNAGTLSVGGISSTTGLTLANGSTYTYTGSTAITSGGLTLETGGGTINVPTGVLLSFGGASGNPTTPGAFTKTGAGRLAFSNADAFGSANSPTVYGTVTTGNITVAEGSLEVNNLRLNEGRPGNLRNLTIAAGAEVFVNGSLFIDPPGTATTYTTTVAGPGRLRIRSTASSITAPAIGRDFGTANDAAPWGTIITAPVRFEAQSGNPVMWIVGKTNRNDVGRYAGDFRFDASLSGGAPLRFQGTNVNSSHNMHFVLNADNSVGFTSEIRIANSDLALTNANALTAANAVTFSGEDLAGTANRTSLFLFGRSVTIGSLNDVTTGVGTRFIRNGARDQADGGTNILTGGGGIALGVQANSVLTITQTTDGVFGGSIQNGPNDTEAGLSATNYLTLAIVKEGSAILNLTGNNNYTGGTTINAGILAINNTAGSGTGTGVVTVNAAGTVRGAGTIGGNLALVGGGKVAPGNSAGTLTVSGTFSGTGVYEFELATAGTPSGTNGGSTPTLPQTNHDLLAITGTADVSGLTINPIAITGSGFNNAQPYSWTVLTATGGVTGTPTLGTPVDFGSLAGGTFSLGLDANNIYLNFTPVPEPATILGLGTLGLLAVAGVRRRRLAN